MEGVEVVGGELVHGFFVNGSISHGSMGEGRCGDTVRRRHGEAESGNVKRKFVGYSIIEPMFCTPLYY